MIRVFQILIFVFSTIVVAQDVGSVAGSLSDKDNNNEPLPFANVIIKGTSKGTTTDFDGNYLLDNIAVGTYTIEFSFVGYETLEVPNVVIEAKACGAVCVVSPSGGGKRILRPNYDGVVINKFTVEEWVKKISDLLSNNDKTKQIKNYLKNQANESWDQIFFRDLVPYWKKIIRLKNEKNTDISTPS